MYNVECSTWGQCSTWCQCSTWGRCSEFIHLRRKPQLEAQGVCKVRVFTNFQSIPRQSPVEYGNFSTLTPNDSLHKEFSLAPGILAAPGILVEFSSSCHSLDNLKTDSRLEEHIG